MPPTSLLVCRPLRPSGVGVRYRRDHPALAVVLFLACLDRIVDSLRPVAVAWAVAAAGARAFRASEPSMVEVASGN
jgi:hypothetical protein